MTLTKALRKAIYKNNVEKGFYENPTEFGTRLMLVVSELGEALEAHRCDPKAKCDKIPEILAIEEEIADTIIRLLDLSEHYGYDLERAVLKKIEYNLSRPYKHGKKY